MSDLDPSDWYALGVAFAAFTLVVAAAFGTCVREIWRQKRRVR